MPPTTRDVIFSHGYQPGVIAEVTNAHVTYYAREWQFGLKFEAKVASELSQFLMRFEPARDMFLCARDGAGNLLGSITIDGLNGRSAEGAHLRWFITSDAGRGTGVGRQLMRRAVLFCDQKDFNRIYLTTFPGLDAARHLYETHGFKLVAETQQDDWHGSVGEQRFVRDKTTTVTSDGCSSSSGQAAQ